MSASASAQSVDWATCGTSPAPCTATSTSCCTEAAATLNLGGSSGDKALVIPMDRCHQQITNSGVFGEPPTTAPAWCVDPSGSSTNGMFHAYGMVYRLMQYGIPVYWIVNPTKTATAVTNYDTPVGNQKFTSTDIDMWIVDSTTSAIPAAAAALTACGGCTPPVTLLNDSLGVDRNYSHKEFPLRGSVFVISGTDTDGDTITDRAEFNAWWGSYGDGNPASGRACSTGPSTDCSDFRAVAMYEVNAGAKVLWRNHITSTTNTGTLPVAIKLNYQPPRVARVASGGNVSELFLRAANLDDSATSACKQGVFVRSAGTLPYGPVVCDLDENDLYNNSLVTGNFGWAWFDGGNTFNNAAACTKGLTALRTFLNGVPGVVTPGNVMVNDTSISQFEACTNLQLLGRAGTAANALTVNNTAVNEGDTTPLIHRYPTNLFAQYGDLPMDFASSSVSHWVSGTTTGYRAAYTGASNTLKRLLTRERTRVAGTNEVCGDTSANGTLDGGEVAHQLNAFPWANSGSCDIDPATAGANGDNVDLAAYGRMDNDPLKGLVFYIPGNNLSSAGVRGELRILLNSLIATPQGAVSGSGAVFEISRSTAVAPLIGGAEYIVQGTYLQKANPGLPTVVNGDSDIGNFRFPHRVGHMRATLPVSPFTQYMDAGCNADTVLAADYPGNTFACPAGTVGIPASRTIFTNLQGGDLRTVSGAKVTFNTSMSSTMKDLMKVGANLSYATIDTMIQRVHAGYLGATGYIPVLGAVDRSTPAVIQASTAAPSGANRPMMAYFGAADGMLHAVCMEVNTSFGCTAVGLELWAFLPRKMLPFIRLNQARIDGSPRVLDAYIDPDGTGTAYQLGWRTVLVFQTGMGDYTLAGREPAVYALDITVPNTPLLLWEFSETSAGANNLGQGLTVTAGATTISLATKYLAWVDTNNLGTNGPGTVVTSIDLASGAQYQRNFFQFNPNPRVSTKDPVARSGIPAGTVPLDLPSGATGKVTNILVNDIYGRLWLLNAETLVSVNGATTPLFKMPDDYFAMGPKPAVYSQGGAQYAVFATGGYTDPSNTTWPLDCCSSANGTSCDAVQPSPPRVCTQNNNPTTGTIFPTQFAIAVKIDTAATATYTTTSPMTACDTSSSPDLATGTNFPDCSTGFLFRRTLGRDQKGSSQALVVGTDIFLATESDNVNRAGYGTTGGSTGNFYKLDGVTGTMATGATAIVLGSGAPVASNSGVGSRTVYGGAAGTFAAGTSTTTGQNVTANATSTGVSRRVWLRTE